MDFGKLIAESPYYFKAGKYTVEEIGPVYCERVPGAEKQWEDHVNEFMNDAIKRYEENY